MTSVVGAPISLATIVQTRHATRSVRHESERAQSVKQRCDRRIGLGETGH